MLNIRFREIAVFGLLAGAVAMASPPNKIAHIDVPEISDLDRLVTTETRYTPDEAWQLADAFSATGYVMLQPGVTVELWPTVSGQHPGAIIGLGGAATQTVVEYGVELGKGQVWLNESGFDLTMVVTNKDGVAMSTVLHDGEMLFVDAVEFNSAGIVVPENGRACQAECGPSYFACCWTGKKNTPICRCRHTTRDSDDDCEAGGKGAVSCVLVKTKPDDDDEIVPDAAR